MYIETVKQKKKIKKKQPIKQRETDESPGSKTQLETRNDGGIRRDKEKMKNQG